MTSVDRKWEKWVVGLRAIYVDLSNPLRNCWPMANDAKANLKYVISQWILNVLRLVQPILTIFDYGGSKLVVVFWSCSRFGWHGLDDFWLIEAGQVDVVYIAKTCLVSSVHVRVGSTSGADKCTRTLCRFMVVTHVPLGLGFARQLHETTLKNWFTNFLITE